MAQQRKQRKGDADMLELLAIAAKAAGKDERLMRSAVKDLFRLNSSLRVRVGSLSVTRSPTAFPSSDRPIGDIIVTWPSSKSSESPNTR